ncbi:MAG: Fic family protein [Litorimonas sp.]
MIAEAERGISRRLAGQRYRLRPSTILSLHRAAVDGIDAYAGAYRPGGVTISRSHHAPPPAGAVAELVEDLCDWVNDHWDSRPPAELSAHVLWQICWIHPFTDGNGRTARAVAYLVLLVAYGLILPGTLTLPEQISEDRRPYYAALEAADLAMEETGTADVSEMEAYIGAMVARQLEAATA